MKETRSFQNGIMIPFCLGLPEISIPVSCCFNIFFLKFSISLSLYGFYFKYSLYANFWHTEHAKANKLFVLKKILLTIIFKLFYFLTLSLQTYDVTATKTYVLLVIIRPINQCILTYCNINLSQVARTLCQATARSWSSAYIQSVSMVHLSYGLNGVLSNDVHYSADIYVNVHVARRLQLLVTQYAW